MGHISNKYQHSPTAFNKYFLTTAGKIIESIKYSNIEDLNNNLDPKYYLYKSFQNSFPNIKFKNTFAKEVERIIRPLKLKNSNDYDEFP
jgi:hypothetical protein